MKNLDPVVEYMVRNAIVQPDGSGMFHGTPRDIMENLGVSSGPLYDALKAQGIVPDKRGRDANWYIPAAVMKAHSAKLIAAQSNTRDDGEALPVRLKKDPGKKREA